MRRVISFAYGGDRLAGTIDEGAGNTGLLIVSGGNEIRSGAHAGQARMAGHFATLGYPVFRFDRRGVGDSEGANGGFEMSADDLAAAVAAFRAEAPRLRKLVAFGNCDAATALALFHSGLAIDRLVLANPWTIDSIADAAPRHSSATIRARYWQRLRSTKALIDLVTGKIDLRKLASGLAKAVSSDLPSQLGIRLAEALTQSAIPTLILIAERDATGRAFMAAWKSRVFNYARVSPHITMSILDTASHSFADRISKDWLMTEIEKALQE